ncbi:transcriptional regulator [Photorhabdus luminescens subsp. luminescens]|uniref:Predicted transcriptional regulator n=1 Tax=Photorhabdus luminescens TaxID=29488 RepID=A0A1G5PP67_PHOLU|nr:MarR family transcriptional regulator [Photorhabdus luminescens]KMW74520.1 transcriptional regulator [Photorhabdus luminescens subsp. luminescens]SCZ51031.1 Predicted transcriptional regulator [Photorhabdus luminescens]
MKALIGVMNEELIRKRTLAIIKGEYVVQPDEPKIWFTSMIALAQVLSSDNIALLRLINEHKPETIAELANLSGRKPSNLSVTLKTLSRHGFVTLEKNNRSVKPKALFTDFEIKIEQEISKRVMSSCGAKNIAA